MTRPRLARFGSIRVFGCYGTFLSGNFGAGCGGYGASCDGGLAGAAGGGLPDYGRTGTGDNAAAGADRPTGIGGGGPAFIDNEGYGWAVWIYEESLDDEYWGER